MNELLKLKGLSSQWFVDSAALIGYHSGELPDERALSVLSTHGIAYTQQARVIQTKDFQEYDYIFGMDMDNMAELKKMSRDIVDVKAQILLLGDFGLDEAEKIIYDPYYVSWNFFEPCNVFNLFPSPSVYWRRTN